MKGKRETVSSKEFIKKLGGGEKALRRLLDQGVNVLGVLERIALLNINSLLEARIILSKECADTLAAERDSLVDKRRNRLLCVMGAPVVGALEEINNILHQSNPPLVFGLLRGLREIRTQDDAEREVEYAKTVAAAAVEQLKGTKKKEIKKRIRRSA